MALIATHYGLIFDTEARTKPTLTLIDENGKFLRAAIFRQAMKMCRQPRTRMKRWGPKALDFDFETYIEFDRRRLGPVLTSLWRRARRERFDLKVYNKP